MSVHKKFFAFLACILLFQCMPCAIFAEPVTNDLDDIICDRIYYADKYSDLKRAFGYDHDQLLNHWRQNGAKEGRSPSSIYDAQYYYNKYADLRNAFTRNGQVDWAGLYNHFKNYGLKEGRQASQHFSVNIYKNNYADLRNAFGTSASDHWKYLKHWREYGMAEKRNATSSIGSNPPQPQPQPQPTQQKRQALQTVPAYTNSALTQRNGNERVDKGDMVTVLQETSNAYYVRYPVSNGTKDRWVSKAIFQNTPVPSGGLRYILRGAVTRTSSQRQWKGFYCDYVAAEGTPIYAPADGRVEFRQSYSPRMGKLSSYANQIFFTSKDGKYTVRCAHLSRFNNVALKYTQSLSFPCGQSEYPDSTSITLARRDVKQGDLLGYSGMTGNASAPHVHIEVTENGQPKNPAVIFTTW